MQHSPDQAHPLAEVMVRLIEEDLWCGSEGGSMDSIPEEASQNLTYLREFVFPTLVPSIYELLKREQRLNMGRTDSLGGSMKYGATGEVDPITWLAQYLLRNNARYEASKIRHHPFSIANSVALAKEKENDIHDMRSEH